MRISDPNKHMHALHQLKILNWFRAVRPSVSVIDLFDITVITVVVYKT